MKMPRSLEFPDPIEPVKPDDAKDIFEVELWKENRKEYRQKQEKRAKNLGKAFALILGQCSRTIRDRVEASIEWTAINNIGPPETDSHVAFL